MKENQRFSLRSNFDVPLSDLFEWHERPGALQRLNPPWDPVELIESDGHIQPGAEVKVRMNMGPFKRIWQARHLEFEKDRFFSDMQVSGPFKSFHHRHSFRSISSKVTELTDDIEFEMPLHPIGTSIMGRFVKNQLSRVFQYRHLVLERDMRIHRQYRKKPRLNFLFTGASGVLGRALIPFLTTGGHKVFSLVRKKEQLGENSFYWNPQAGQFDIDQMPHIDVIVHLAGENIGQGRWTPELKKRIIDSRLKTTETLNRLIDELPETPKLYLSASAVGYYGETGIQDIDERASAGQQFVSKVCEDWENAA